MTSPCSSYRITGGNNGQSTSTPSCSSWTSCQSCADRGGVFIKSSSSSSSGSCYSSYSTCDKSYYSLPPYGCSSPSCLESYCRSGGDCTTPTPTPAPGPAPGPTPAPGPGPGPGPGPSSSACTSSQPYNCGNCEACTRSNNYWSSSSPSNPSSLYSSNTIGTCYTSYDSAPCGSYVFSWCTSTASSQSYRSSCSNSRVDNTLFYVVIAVPLVIWLINIIAIAAVARRKGLNPCMYVILAVFFSVFAWFCLCCGSNQSGGQALIGRVGGVELKSMNVQAYAATPSGSYASNFQAQPSAPDPYSANAISKPSEIANAVPNPYAANAVPNPYAANNVSNPYAANNVSNPHSQSPAPAPYANAVPDAYNPYAANSGAASAPPAYNPYAANSGAASAPPYEQPHAPAFQSSSTSTPSPQPAAFDQYSQNVYTQASAENSQNEPVIMPY